MRVTRSLGHSALVAVLALLATGFVDISSSSAKTQPPVNWSFYIKGNSYTAIVQLGCNQATYDGDVDHNSLVVLDFGGIYTTTGNGVQEIFDGTLLPQSRVETLGEAFAYGYHKCSTTSHSVILAIGTNNYLRLSYSKGQAFARTVKAVSSYAGTYDPDVTVWGANDIESWENPGLSPTDTNNWYNGYAATGGPMYFDYGSVTTCPTSGFGPTCNDGWTQGDYYNLAWRFSLALPLPEIYSTADAERWYWVSDYGSGFAGMMQPYAPVNENDRTSSTLDTKTSWNALSFFFCPHTGCNDLTYLVQMHTTT